jgi:2-alkenal reductase
MRTISQTPPTPVAEPTVNPAEATIPTRPHAQEDVMAEEELLTSLYKKVSPSVVQIRITQKVEREASSPFREWPGAPSFPYLPDLPQMPGEFYRRGEGSGFVWDDEGHIVTNYHVVEGASIVDVHFFDETVVEAEVAGVNAQSDIAVLRVDRSATRLQPVTLGDSDSLQVGQVAIVIGNPFIGGTLARGENHAAPRDGFSTISLVLCPLTGTWHRAGQVQPSERDIVRLSV